MKKVKQIVKQSSKSAGKSVKTSEFSYKFGAGDRARTGDNLLGRQGLYQLSYSRP